MNGSLLLVEIVRSSFCGIIFRYLVSCGISPLSFSVLIFDCISSYSSLLMSVKIPMS